MPNRNTPATVNVTWTGNMQPILSIEASNDTIICPWGGQAGLPATTITVPGPGMCVFNYANEWPTLDKLLSMSVDSRWYCGNVSLVVSAASLTALAFPKLEAIIVNGLAAGLNITAANMATLDLSKLRYVHTGGGGSITIGQSAVTVLDLPALTHCIADSGTSCMSVGSCPNLTTVNIPNIVEIGGAGGPFNALTFSMSNGNITTVHLGQVGVTKIARGFVDFSSNKLDQASVDGILALYASLDGTNGTVLYSSGTINLSGTGTGGVAMASPSFAGQTVNVTAAADAGGGKTTLTTADIVAAGGATWAVGDYITIPSTSAIVPTSYKGTYQIVAGTNDATHCTITKTYAAVTTPGASKRGAVGDGYRNYQILTASRSCTVSIN